MTIFSNSQAIAHTCDVTSWEQQLELFQRTLKEYGTVDVVVANAGIIEKGPFVPAEVDVNNVPIKPKLITINVNLIGVLYSKVLFRLDYTVLKRWSTLATHLAQHYLLLDHQPGPGALKSLVLIGSMCLCTSYSYNST